MAKHSGEGEALSETNITAEQIVTTLAAVPAFLPVTVCTGYLAAWLTDLNRFRQRSLVERLFWSIPLSIAISTITLVLIGRFFSINAAAFVAILSVAGCVVVFAMERQQLHRSRRHWSIGVQPLGGTVLVLSLLWIAYEVFSLVDFQRDQHLFMSLTFYDIGTRVNWANSILRTGIPPANPLYFYLHASNLRYYYFWLVDCSVVAKISRLPMRSIVGASCIWSGFCLAALTGLYLKHFLSVGSRLRGQFLIASVLPAVGSFSLCIYFWNMFVRHIPFPGDVWTAGQISDFVNFFLFYPHHLVSMVCCMFAFLLAWMGTSGNSRDRIVSIIFIAAALASAFGLSVYVTFAFFLLMVCWAVFQCLYKRLPGAPLLLLIGGVVACVLLAPYLHEITHTTSRIAGAGNAPFTWSVRETIPPDRLANSLLLREIAAGHPEAARTIAKLTLLLPGFALELGLYFLTLLIFLVPAWRGDAKLTAAQQTLLFLAIATFPITAFIRSSVISVNDFGIHSALFIAYPLLLLASELLVSWRLERSTPDTSESTLGLPARTPHLLRSLVTLAVIIGVLSTAWRVLVLRFTLPLASINAGEAKNPQVADLPHDAYTAYFSYTQLNSRIPVDAVVQFNPAGDWMFWKNVDLININRQVAITADQLWCGSELGGDPSGCPGMISAITPLFSGATAEQARSVCRQYGIQYLIAKVYDPAWADKSGWVWTLKPVVTDPEFRALDCRE